MYFSVIAFFWRVSLIQPLGPTIRFEVHTLETFKADTTICSIDCVLDGDFRSYD